MEESQNTGTVTKEDSFQILQKVEDMILYARPIMKRWSVADKHDIGNTLMDNMKELVQLSVDIREKYYKKTTLTDFDRKNKTLQEFIKLAYDMNILKGLSSYKEWTRRSEEIGRMIGGFINTVNGANSDADNTATQQQKSSRYGNSRYKRH